MRVRVAVRVRVRLTLTPTLSVRTAPASSLAIASSVLLNSFSALAISLSRRSASRLAFSTSLGSFSPPWHERLGRRGGASAMAARESTWRGAASHGAERDCYAAAAVCSAQRFVVETRPGAGARVSGGWGVGSTCGVSLARWCLYMRAVRTTTDRRPAC